MIVFSPPSFDPTETYGLIANSKGVLRGSDGATIPADPRNADWIAYQAWLASGKTPTAAPAPPTPPLATVQAQAIAEMAAWADAAVAPYEAGVSSAERSSWALKFAEATAVAANAAAPTPTLAAEVAVTGETVAALAKLVLGKAAQYQAISGAMAGLRRTTAAAIMAATTPAGVEAALSAALAKAKAALAKIGPPA